MKAIDIQKPILYNQILMSGNKVSESRLKELIAAAMFAALTVIGAQIKIPLPAGVPVTLQTFFVILSGYLLGSFYGPLSQLIYLFAGLIGFPVFAEGGGPAYVLKPTFGYLVGYPLASFVVGKITYGKHVVRDLMSSRFQLGKVTKGRLLLAGMAGILAIFAPGVAYLYFATNYILQVSTPFSVLFTGGFLIFIPGDIIKLTTILIFLSFWTIRENSQN